MKAPPVKNTYWVVEGKLLAGEYPAHGSDDVVRTKLAVLLDAGIRTFVDLTEAGELVAYDDTLADLAAEQYAIRRDHGAASVLQWCTREFGLGTEDELCVHGAAYMAHY